MTSMSPLAGSSLAGSFLTSMTSAVCWPPRSKAREGGEPNNEIHLPKAGLQVGYSWSTAGLQLACTGLFGSSNLKPMSPSTPATDTVQSWPTVLSMIMAERLTTLAFSLSKSDRNDFRTSAMANLPG